MRGPGPSREAAEGRGAPPPLTRHLRVQASFYGTGVVVQVPPHGNSLMPKSIRSRRAYRRSSYRNRKYRYRRYRFRKLTNTKYSKSIVQKGLLGYPASMHTRLRYNTRYHFTDAGGYYEWPFRGNSLYDPDSTLGGDTVIGLPQFAILYKQYRVLGSMIRVTALNQDDANPVRISVWPDESANVLGATTLEGVGQHYARSAIGINDSKAVVVNKCRTSQLFHLKALDDPGFWAIMAASPVYSWHWHVLIDGTHGTALDCWVYVDIWFDTVFSDSQLMHSS